MERRQFQEYVESRITSWGERASRLESISDVAETLDDECEVPRISELARGCSEVAALLKDLTEAPAGDWQGLRARVEGAIEDVEAAFDVLEGTLQVKPGPVAASPSGQ